LGLALRPSLGVIRRRKHDEAEMVIFSMWTRRCHEIPFRWSGDFISAT
jgi:hypothetical protein